MVWDSGISTKDISSGLRDSNFGGVVDSIEHSSSEASNASNLHIILRRILDSSCIAIATAVIAWIIGISLCSPSDVNFILSTTSWAPDVAAVSLDNTVAGIKGANS